MKNSDEHSFFPFTLSELETHFAPALQKESLFIDNGAAFWLHKQPEQKLLAVLFQKEVPWILKLEGQVSEFSADYRLLLAPLSTKNYHVLRDTIPHLKPGLLGLATSIGLGDRLGLATPGHVRALQHTGGHIAPIFAQQSIREMNRTKRTPHMVMEDATWGLFAKGWLQRWGADADHLKTPEDIDACAEAGFTFFTIDPGGFVNPVAETVTSTDTLVNLDKLNWAGLESSLADMHRRYVNKTVEISNQKFLFEEPELLRAILKYGNAIAHIAFMFRHLEAKGIPFELEVSVDETDIPTTHLEHIFIASELKRLGVKWVSLAPRFIGRFEKGVDYIGDLDQLRADLNGHAAIARCLGPYKLSLHSGSDKFSVYPLLAQATDGMAHLKTAGTSYVEALRVVALVDPSLFKEIFELSCARYTEDRATYHVSADLERIPDIKKISNNELTFLLDHFDTRQILHVTFGSVLEQHGESIKNLLIQHDEQYQIILMNHFQRHLEPFRKFTKE